MLYIGLAIAAIAAVGWLLGNDNVKEDDGCGGYLCSDGTCGRCRDRGED